LYKIVAQIMDDHGQDSLSGEHIKGWIEKAGMELVSEVEKTADLGGK
jgi:hypothetical protein